MHHEFCLVKSNQYDPMRKVGRIHHRLQKLLLLAAQPKRHSLTHIQNMRVGPAAEGSHYPR